MGADPSNAQHLMLQNLLQNFSGGQPPAGDQGSNDLSRLFAARGVGASGEGAILQQQLNQQQTGAGQQQQQQQQHETATDLQRLAQLVQSGQLSGNASNEMAALAAAVQQQQQQQQRHSAAAGSSSASGANALMQLLNASGTQTAAASQLPAGMSDNNANLPSLLLWANLLQAYGTDASRPNPLQEALGSSLSGGGGTGGLQGYTSLKRTRDGELAVQGSDRSRLEGYRHASLSHLQSGNWPQSLSALAQLSQALNGGGAAGGGSGGFDAATMAAAAAAAAMASGAGGLGVGGGVGGAAAAADPEAGYVGYTVRRNNAKAGHWTEKEKEQLIGLVQELKPTSAAQWEVVADLMGKWSPKGASAERMYRTLTDPGYYRATNKHGRRLNSRTSIPMYIKAVYALLQLGGHEGNLTQISDVIARHPDFSRELDWTPRPGAKTYPRWKDALLSCFKEGRYPYLEKTAKKDGGSTVYRLRLDALRAEDVQKYMKFLDIPPPPHLPPPHLPPPHHHQQQQQQQQPLASAAASLASLAGLAGAAVGGGGGGGGSGSGV